MENKKNPIRRKKHPGDSSLALFSTIQGLYSQSSLHFLFPFLYVHHWLSHLQGLKNTVP